MNDVSIGIFHGLQLFPLQTVAEGRVFKAGNDLAVGEKCGIRDLFLLQTEFFKVDRFHVEIECGEFIVAEGFVVKTVVRLCGG